MDSLPKYLREIRPLLATADNKFLKRVSGAWVFDAGSASPDTFNLGIWSDLHYGVTGYTGGGTTALNAIAADMLANVPLDMLISAGDNIHNQKALWAEFKTWVATNLRDRGVRAVFVEGNHDAMIYGNAENTVDGVAGSWMSDYAYVQTTLASSVTAGASSCSVVSAAGLSSGQIIMFWDDNTQTGEAKHIDSIVGTTINMSTVFANNFAASTSIVFQGRDKDLLYSNLRNIYGASSSELNEHGLSNVTVWGNNVFIALSHETYYDNADVATNTLYLTDTALDWLEAQLSKYQGYNVFVFAHAPITDSGIQTEYTVTSPAGSFAGNSARVKTICQTYAITAWFAGHAHFDPTNSDEQTIMSNTPVDFGGTLFVGIPWAGRVPLYNTNADAWWYRAIFAEGDTSITLELRNSTTGAWQTAYDITVPLTFAVTTQKPELSEHLHSNKPTIDKLSESAGSLLFDGDAIGGLTNPMTAVGDIIIGGTAGVPTRLGIGAEGYVLGVVSGNPAYMELSTVGTPASAVPLANNAPIMDANGSLKAFLQALAFSNWLPGTLPSGNWRDVAWNGTVFCAVAYAGTVAATSPDGCIWTARTLPASANWTKIAWNGTVFCAIAYGSNVAATSPDGITWTQRTLPSTSNWRDICWNGTVFCAIADGTTAAATSPDGITWTARTMPENTFWYRLAWNGTVFCAIAYGTTIAATSPTGETWTQRTLPANPNWTAIAWNGSVFCIVATGSTIAATSPDGATWTQREMPSNKKWQVICAFGSVLVAMAQDSNSLAYSSNGTTWSTCSTSIYGSWYGIASNGFILCAVSTGASSVLAAISFNIG